MVMADDGCHRQIRIGPEEFLDDAGRIVLLTDAWSHQLGGRNATRSLERGASVSCFEAEAVRPLTDDTARAFRLGSREAPRRAPPAWK